MSKKIYRLKQPLFGWPGLDPYVAKNFRPIVLSYDVIYNLLEKPEDIHPAKIKENALAVLEHLGFLIEMNLGKEIFLTEEQPQEPQQLEFKFEGDSNE